MPAARFHVRAAVDSLEPRCLLTTYPPGFADVLVGGPIANGMATSFAPDGRLFVAQRTGELRVIDHGVLQATPFTVVPTVDMSGNPGADGLNGVVVDPNFAVNHYVYIYYLALTPSPHNRLSRFTADPNNLNVALPGSETVLVELNNVSTFYHESGGPMAFGPDGKLYLATGNNGYIGDQTHYSNAQSMSSLMGKVLRINKDGTIPTDNPFFNDPVAVGQNKLIWALGLGRPTGIAFQRTTGRMLITDVGAQDQEVNEGAAHANYGYPFYNGNYPYSTTPPMQPTITFPLFQYNFTGRQHGTIVGGLFYNPIYNSFGASYAGQYFFGDNFGSISNIDPNAPPVFPPYFTEYFGPMTSLELGPDGSIYILRNDPSASSVNGVYRIYNADTTAPNSSSPAFVFNEAKPAFGTSQRFRVAFNEFVGDSLAPSDLVLTNLTTRDVVPSANISIQYDTSTNTATFSFPGYSDANGVLPNGNYRAQIASSAVSDLSGNALSSSISFDFFALAGDVNRDRVVNASDAAIITANLSLSGRTYSQGDLNYDGSVTTADQTIYTANKAFLLQSVGTTANVPVTAGNDLFTATPESSIVVDLYDGTGTGGTLLQRIYVGTGAATSINYAGSGGDTLTVIGRSTAETFAFSTTGTAFGATPLNYSGLKTIRFDTGGGFDNLTVNAPVKVLLVGTQQLNNVTVTGTATTGGTIDPIVARTVSITGSGKFDVNDNDFIVTNTPRSTIEGYIRTAYNFGDWNGPAGIMSSTAKNNPAANTTLGLLSGNEYTNNSGDNHFDGVTVNASDVLVKYTYFGDVDFNGSVDVSDYNLIDFGFVNHLTGWSFGDADYSGGPTDVSDYNVIDFAFATQGAAL